MWAYATDQGISLGAWGLSATRDPFESMSHMARSALTYTTTSLQNFCFNSVSTITDSSTQNAPLDGYQFLAQIEKGIASHD